MPAATSASTSPAGRPSTVQTVRRSTLWLVPRIALLIGALLGLAACTSSPSSAPGPGAFAESPVPVTPAAEPTAVTTGPTGHIIAMSARVDPASRNVDSCTKPTFTYPVKVSWKVTVVPRTVVQGFKVYDSLGNVQDLPSMLSRTDDNTIELSWTGTLDFTPPRTVEFWVSSNAPNVVTSNRAAFRYTCGSN